MSKCTIPKRWWNLLFFTHFSSLYSQKIFNSAFIFSVVKRNVSDAFHLLHWVIWRWKSYSYRLNVCIDFVLKNQLQTYFYNQRTDFICRFTRSFSIEIFLLKSRCRFRGKLAWNVHNISDVLETKDATSCILVIPRPLIWPLLVRGGKVVSDSLTAFENS